MAEASITLTRITIGTDDAGSLARRVYSEAAHVGQDFGRGLRAVFTDCRLYDRHQLALHRSVMPLGTLPQPLDHIVGSILDRLFSGSTDAQR